MRTKEINGMAKRVLKPDFSGVYGLPMKKLMGYLTDWRRERRIRELTFVVKVLWARGLPRCAQIADRERIAEINARSPAQVARMERRMGLR